jgi:hypothetical protein
MLFLAKADNGLIVPSSEPVDLAAAVRPVLSHRTFPPEGKRVVRARAGDHEIDRRSA